MKEKFKAIEKVFLIFIIGSICGYIFETIVVLFQKGHFEIRQGVIYGPFIPVCIIYFSKKYKLENYHKYF